MSFQRICHRPLGDWTGNFTFYYQSPQAVQCPYQPNNTNAEVLFSTFA